MTPDEKYKEIVESRKVATGSDDPSGVKTDPPANTNEDHQQPGDGKQQPNPAEDGNSSTPTPPTHEEKQQHAIAKMRADFNRELAALRKENEELKARFNGAEKTPEKKTRKDFQTDDEYGDYLRKQIEESVKADFKKQQDESEKAQKEKMEFAKSLSDGLEKIQKGLSEKVFKDLNDEGSEMFSIIKDDRAEPIREMIRKSGRRADLLALMQAKPGIFQQIMELPEEHQKYRLYSLVDAIDSKYSQLEKQHQADKQKEERAASLPAAGAFGVNGTGTTDISGLSTAERVNRYKADMIKKRTR